MNSIKAIIVDDERLARVNLKRLLECHKEIEIIAEADSCEKAVVAINHCKPDLVFLDIQLTGESGFDILEKIEIDTQIVFVTAYDEYAIHAFEVNAVDYLLKPVNPARLAKTIERILKTENPPKTDVKKYKYDDVIYVKLNTSVSKFIKLNSIIVISSVGNYTKLTACDGRNYFVLKTIKQWQSELPENHFIRIHRARIINLEYVTRLEKQSNNSHLVYLRDIEKPTEVSRRFSSKLKTVNRD